MIEETVFGTGRLDGFDIVQARHRNPVVLTHIPFKDTGHIDSLRRNITSQHNIQQHGTQAYQCQPNTIAEHESEIQHQQHHLNGQWSQLLHQCSCNVLIGFLPENQITHIALGEEVHRQPQQMPEEVAVGFKSHGRIVLPAINTLQPFGQYIHAYHRHESCHEGLEPIRILAAQNIVHKYLREQRSGYPNDCRQQAGHKDKESSRPGILQSSLHKAQNGSTRTSRLKRFCRLEHQGNACKGPVEFFLSNFDLSSPRVIQVMGIPPFPLVYYKVVEVPMDDGRSFSLQLVLIQLIGIGFHAVASSSQKQLLGRTTVTRYATILS